MSSTGGWSRRPGAAVLGLTAGVWRRAGSMLSSAVLGHTVGACVSVGLLLGLVGSILCVSGVRVVGVGQAIKAL